MKLLPLILLCVLSTGAFLRSVAQDTGYLPEEDHGTITHSAVLNAFRILNPKQN